VEINLQNQVGRTALHMAALSNSYDIITQLVTSGVERERPDLLNYFSFPQKVRKAQPLWLIYNYQ